MGYGGWGGGKPGEVVGSTNHNSARPPCIHPQIPAAALSLVLKYYSTSTGGAAVPKTLKILALPRFLGGFDIVYRGQPEVTMGPQNMLIHALQNARIFRVLDTATPP